MFAFKVKVAPLKHVGSTVNFYSEGKLFHYQFVLLVFKFLLARVNECLQTNKNK